MDPVTPSSDMPELSSEDLAAAATAAAAVTGKHVCLLTPDVAALKAKIAELTADLAALQQLVEPLIPVIRTDWPLLKKDVEALKSDVGGIVAALKALGVDAVKDAGAALGALETKVSAIAGAIKSHFGINL